MTKRFGMFGALACLAVVLAACGKAAVPATPAVSAAPAVTEEHSVNVPVPSSDAAAPQAATAPPASPAPDAPVTPPVANAPSNAPSPASPAGGEQASATPPASDAPSVSPASAAPTEGEVAKAEPGKDAAAASSAPAPPASEKIARVGDMIITAQEFARDVTQRAAQLAKERGQQPNPDDPSFRATVLAEMIDARVLRWVATHAVTVTDEEVNREYGRGRRVLGSQGNFEEYLKREGLDEAGLKALLRDRLAIEAYKNQKFDGAAVSEEEIKKLYDEWSAAGRFDRKERTADIQHLGVHQEGDQPADLEKAKTTVEAARARIAAGEAFDKVAIEVSDDKNVAQSGGMYPEVSPSNLPPYIGERLFKQTPGELSEPFEGGKAWHLVKVLSVNEPGKVTFEKAHDQIRNYLLEGRRRECVTKAVDQAKYLMDIEIFKTELRPKQGPGANALPKPPEPPAQAPADGSIAAPKAETKDAAAQ